MNAALAPSRIPCRDDRWNKACGIDVRQAPLPTHVPVVISTATQCSAAYVRATRNIGGVGAIKSGPIRIGDYGRRIDAAREADRIPYR